MRILWGPFNHQNRDRWLESSLGKNPSRSFGPFGAELIYRPEQRAYLLPQIAAFDPELILVLDPHLRLIGPDLLAAPCPVVACSGVYPFSGEQWSVFDGLLPVDWQVPDAIRQHLPVGPSLSDWQPAQSRQSATTPRLHPLLCLAEHVPPDLERALTALEQPVIYLDSPDPLTQQQLCAQSEVVLIPGQPPLSLALEAWAAGARLLVSEQMAPALRALLTPGSDFVCFQAETLAADVYRAQALEPRAIAFPWQQGLLHGLRAIWPEIQARSQKRQQQPAQQALLASMWAMSPVQREALPLLQTQSPWLQTALEPQQEAPATPPQTPGEQLSAARYFLSTTQTTAAHTLLRPLMQQTAPPLTEAFPVPAQAARCQNREEIWKLALLSTWLESQPPDFSPLLSESAPPWPLKDPLEAWLPTQTAAPAPALADWLIAHWPAQARLRAKALALLPEAQKQAAAPAAVSLYQQQGGRQPERSEWLASLLASAPKLPDQPGLVIWEGIFASHTSFARVNLGLQKGLQEQAGLEHLLCELGAAEVGELSIPLRLPQTWRWPEILVSHTIPHREKPPSWGGKWVAVMPWEYGLAPRHSVACLADEVDEVWLPSHYSLEAYQRSGVPAERLQVIPNGVDTELYCPEGPVYKLPTRKSFCILFVGGTISRKGFDILLEAYLQAFGPNDDVCLVVKDYGGKGQYATGLGLQRLKQAMAKPHHPEIVLLADDHLSDAALSSLYRACQLSVHPYRGEGFCMPLLEAMACGLAVVTPDAGPALEFCPPAASWRVPTVAHFMARHQTLKPNAVQNYTRLPSFYFEPQQAALAQLLKQLVANPAACAAKGRAARAAALDLDWKRIGQRAQARLETLRQTPLNRRERREQAAAAHLEQQHAHNPAEALSLALRASQLWPESGVYWLSLAQRQLELSQTQEASQSLRRAFAQGLDLGEALAVPPLAHLWQPPRIWKDPRCDLPLPADSAWIRRVETLQEADFGLSNQPQPASGARQIVYLAHPAWQSLRDVSVHEIWTAERAWAEPLLQRGLPEERLFEVPVALDFSRFTPGLLPQFGPTPRLSLLSVTHWRHNAWQELLAALSRIRKTAIPLSLTLVPLGVAPEQAQSELQQALQQQTLPPLTLRLQAPSQQARALRELYQQHSCFVDTDPLAGGHWHLLAQAMGIPCISAGQRRFLERPYTEICQSRDPQELAWRLEERLANPKAVRDGLSIREHLRLMHDRPLIATRIVQRLGQLALLQALKDAA